MTLHHDELRIDLQLVRSLVDRGFPQFGSLPLRPASASGSSNALFRLGDQLVVRLPRQPGGGATIEKEARWSPVLAERLPVPVPAVVGVGDPAFGYPERWSIVQWADGEVPPTPVPGGAQLANDLADVVRALGAIDVPAAARSDASLRWYRGGPLSAVDAEIRGYLDQCRELPELDLDFDRCARIWRAAAALEVRHREPRWLHGDLVAENLLVRDGRLAAVLDFGALSIGSPAADLVVAWELLEPAARASFRTLVDADDATWLVGRAWALAIALMTFPYYRTTMPDRCAARLTMARAVLQDAADE